MVIWITGISGAGKTTLSVALYELLKPRLPELVLIDGDAVRAMFGENLDYSEASRMVQIKRIQALVHYLARQGIVVIAAALYAHPDLLAWNRANLPGYFEVYIKAPLHLVRARDPKGLYEKAARGDMPNVVGVDIPWHEPSRPDMVIDATISDTPSALARRVAGAVPRLAAALPRA